MKKISKTVTLIILLIIVVCSAVVYSIVTREDEGVCGSSNSVNCINPDTRTSESDSEFRIETEKYSILAKDGIQNESKTEPSRGGIVLNYEEPYGAIKIEVFNSRLDFAESINRGQVTNSEVEVSGRPAIQQEIDYSNVVFGPSDKNLLRYGFEFDDIPMDDGTKTVFYIKVLAKDDLTASEVSQFKSDARVLIDSLIIR